MTVTVETAPALASAPGVPVNFNGRGVWVWNANPAKAEQLAATLAANHFQYLVVKAHEGTRPFNVGKIDAYAVAAARHRLAFGLWGYLKAHDAAGEARVASQLVRAHGAVFYFADAEDEYEEASAPVSRTFASTFRQLEPTLPAALSSFGRIDLHRLDWKAWRSFGFEFHPQAYACESNQLQPAACVSAAVRVWPPGQIRPTVGAYKGALGRLAPAQLAGGLRGLKTRGFNVWSADEARLADYRALGQVGLTPVSGGANRPLALTSPHLEGDDVRALQVAVNALRARWQLAAIGVDGDFGPDTQAATAEAAWLLGLTQDRYSTAPVSVGVQRLVRDPSKRGPRQLALSQQRLQHLHDAPRGAKAALDFARRQVNRCEEQPVGSDRSPLIDQWGKPYGSPQKPGQQGWEWCGIFVAACLRQAQIEVPAGFIFTPTGLGYAIAGTHGFRRGLIPPAQAKPGDVVWYDFIPTDKLSASHVGIVERNLGGGVLQTIEGNTAPQVGPSKGTDYGVFRRHRDNHIVGCGRPRYPA